MGVTLKGYKCGVDLTYGGFHLLRCHIAALYDRDVAETYWSLFQNYPQTNVDLMLYEEKMQDLEQEGENLYGKLAAKQLFDFLFQSDTDGYASYGFCKNVCKRVSEYYTTIEVQNLLDANYGYAAHPVNGSNVVLVLQSCANSKKPLTWF